MTFEHRLLIGFDEIKAIVFECNTCKTRTSIAIKEFNAPPLLCPKQHAWTTNKPTIEATPALNALALLLQRLGTEDSISQTGFKIFLEFEAEKMR